MGAIGNRLTSTANSLNIQIENLTRSESGLADTDLAEEISNLQQGLLRFETSIRALASQLQNEQSRSRLLDFTIYPASGRWQSALTLSGEQRIISARGTPPQPACPEWGSRGTTKPSPVASLAKALGSKSP